MAYEPVKAYEIVDRAVNHNRSIQEFQMKCRFLPLNLASGAGLSGVIFWVR